MKCMSLVLLTYILGGALFAQMQNEVAENQVEPRAGQKGTFTLAITGPYVAPYSAVQAELPVKSIAKGTPFVIKITWTNTANGEITIPLFAQADNQAGNFDIRNSQGKLAFNEACLTEVKEHPPFGPGSWHRMSRRLKQGEQTSDDFLEFGIPGESCFDTDVPGTYTIKLRKLDPATGNYVYSNKLKVKITP